MSLDDAKLKRLIQTAPDKLDRWLHGVAYDMLGDIQQSFGTSPPGRTYSLKRFGSRVRHVASQPDYPPNINTGALRASMHVIRRGDLHYEIRDGVEYGIILEYGKGPMAPRPFVRPVFDDWSRKIARDLQNSGLFDV